MIVILLGRVVVVVVSFTTIRPPNNNNNNNNKNNRKSSSTPKTNNNNNGFFSLDPSSPGLDDELGRNLLEKLIIINNGNSFLLSRDDTNPDDDHDSKEVNAFHRRRHNNRPPPAPPPFAKVGKCSTENSITVHTTPEFYELLQRAKELPPELFQLSLLEEGGGTALSSSTAKREDLVFGNKCILASDLCRIAIDDEESNNPPASTTTATTTTPYSTSRLFYSIFETTIDSMAMHGHQTKLSRYDLFHGHIFQTSLTSTNNSNVDMDVLGMLLHCYEYPNTTVTASTTTNPKEEDEQPTKEEDEEEDSIASPPLPLVGINLGYCQIDSDCFPSLEEWRFRNVLWAAWCPRCCWDDGSSNDKDDGHGSVVSESSSKEIHLSNPPPLPCGCCDCGCWLLDGKAPEIAALRMDGTTEFGIHCPNTVWEGYFGGKLLGDIYLILDSGEWYISSTTSTSSSSSFSSSSS